MWFMILALAMEEFFLQRTSSGETNVVTVYLVPHLMERLKNKVKSEAQPGTRIICAVYPFPDWEPVEQDGLAYLYIV